MPQLPPRYESQVSPQANRRIIEQPTFAADTSMGDALTKVGQVGLEVADRIQKAQTDQEIVKAEIDARTRLDKLKRDLEADAETPEAALPVRWRQESEAILKDASGKIGSERARTLWMDRAKGWQGEGANWTADLSRKRSVEKVRGGHITSIAELNATAGDASVSPETRAAQQVAVLAGIKSSADLGLIGPDDVARYEAEIAVSGVKDRSVRWTAQVEALADQGQFETAEKLAAEGGKAGIPKAYVDDAKSSITRAKSRIEKERNDRWSVNDANFQVGVMEGKNGYRHIDDAIANGDLNPARRDTLYRAVRTEEDRRNAEAAASQLSAAERAAVENRSKDIRFVFNSMSEMDPARFMGGKETWSDQHRAYYDLMTPSDQRAVDEQVQKMLLDGPKVGPTNAIERALLDEAKRVVPEWRLGSDADPKNLPTDSIPFGAVLRKVAEELSPSMGGKEPTVDQARDAVARALREYQPDKWMGLPTNQGDVYLENPGAASFKTEANTMTTDGGSRFAYDEGANIRNDLRAAFIREKRREPTKAELDAEYARVVAD